MIYELQQPSFGPRWQRQGQASSKDGALEFPFLLNDYCVGSKASVPALLQAAHLQAEGRCLESMAGKVIG